MFHDDHRIAEIAQLAKHPDQPGRVARMQSDAGLVENIERTRQVAAERRGEVDALALAPGEGGGKAVEREVTQPYVGEIGEPVAYLDQHTRSRLHLVRIQLQAGKELHECIHTHGHELGDVLSAHFHVKRLAAEPASAASAAERLSRIPREQYAVLYLVTFAFKVGEKIVQPFEMAVARP